MTQPSAGQVHVDGYSATAAGRSRKRKKGKREMKLLKADTPLPAAVAYSDREWERACLIDSGDPAVDVRKRCSVPVRDPDGAFHLAAMRSAADEIRKSGAHELVKARAARRLAKRMAKCGLPVRVPVEKASLSSKQRAALPDTDFVFPATREYPIPDEAHARNALARGAQNETGARLAKIRAAVKAKFPGIDVSKADVEIRTPIWKDDAKQIVYGVVLTPGVHDSQGDVVSAEDVEKAAHAYLVAYRKHDVQHAEVITNAAGEPLAETVESFIAPDDMTVAGQKVLKGSWVLGAHINDPVTWRKVQKKELTGFSIGGSGERLPDEPGVA